MAESRWLKSSFSESSGNACIEIAATDMAVALRESDDTSRVITTEHHVFRDLLVGIKADVVTAVRY
ncbi:DUF397 domain-containing protein [Streptomyces chrestomyceticus]|uniref:DUF397 domain-containing protein n=1 Tax=Streptomyces chrestomyceticus TaxID=68185 RepID=UPI0019D128EC|nr:DUF397 domain-containing protein [Streptomyces chrestomyceticus]